MDIINKLLAQKLVDSIKDIIPYGINIMNESGIIIASSDETRIGKVHNMALEAIHNNSVAIVREVGDGMKPGVNVPIYYHEKICGVFGISGDADTTMAISQLVKCVIELIVEQEATRSILQIKQQIKAQFLYEWIYHQTSYSHAFILRGQTCGIQINGPRRVCIVELDAPNTSDDLFETNFNHEGKSFYCLRLTATGFIFIFNTLQPLDAQLARIQELAPNVRIAVGEAEEIVYNSFSQAETAIRLGPTLFPEKRVFFYSDIQYFDAMLSGISHMKFSASVIERSSIWSIDREQRLLKTFLAFVAHNGDINATAQKLHIHRNTLNYRLEKIHQLTNRDPGNYMDMFSLYCDYVLFKRNA